jgi:protein-S-isoprenylcysteine O-methyltransferase Ste14
MTWTPSLQIGFWNAWLLMLFVPLQPLILVLIDKLVGTGGINKKMGGEPADETLKRLGRITTLLLYGMVIFSVFLPLKLGTTWLYTGLLVCLAGLVIFMAAIVSAARTPYGEAFIRGMYRYSRHPIYLSVIVILLGVSIASASWVFLLLSAVFTCLTIYQVPGEEQACLVLFGESYRFYMNITPRWIGIPKARKN